METKLLNLNGQEVGKLEFPQEVFSRKVDIHFLHELVKYYLANKRIGTACAKTRAEVNGSNRKPCKQKGTGRARHVSTRSPLWRTGGVVFGPRPHSFKLDMPRTKRRTALMEALSAKYADGSVMAVENLDIKEAKTKNVKDILKALKIDGEKVLFVMDKAEDKFILASRNMKKVSWFLGSNINAYVILRANKIVFTSSGLESAMSLFSGDSLAKKTEEKV